MVALAKALQRAGHEACLGTTAIFAEEIQREHIPFLALPPNWSQAEFNQVTQQLCAAPHQLKQFRLIYQHFGPFVDAISELVADALEGHDLLIANYLFPFFKFIAQRQQKPFVSLSLCPNLIPRRDRPPENILPLTWLPVNLRRSWNRLGWQLVDWILTRTIRRALKSSARSLPADAIGSFISDPDIPVLVACSQSLMRDAELIKDRFQFTGYLRHQPAADTTMQQTLVDFCQGSKVPVITFGSMVTAESQAKFELFLATWPTDRKIIAQAGWANLRSPSSTSSPSRSSDNLLILEKCSHDLLFEFASVVIHHGGAGTTASVLHAGKPQIVIPHLGDQYFWADQVVAHGLGARLTFAGWPNRLRDSIEQIEANPEYISQAADLAEKMRHEEGGPSAVAALAAILSAS